MIWGKTFDEVVDKIKEESEWHAKFIWLWPVRLTDGRWAWMQTIMQKRIGKGWVRDTEAQYVQMRMNQEYFASAMKEPGQTGTQVIGSPPPPWILNPVNIPAITEITK